MTGARSRRTPRPASRRAGRASSGRRSRRSPSRATRRRRRTPPSGSAGWRASTRARGTTPCTSHAGRAGRGSRRARGSGRDRCRPSLGCSKCRSHPSEIVRGSCEAGLHPDGGWMLDYPFQVVEAVVVVAALPVTVAVLWLLLRTPAGSRLVAVPNEKRWHERETPTFGGIGIFAGFAAGIAAALATGAIEWSSELGGILGGVALLFAAGLVDDLWHLNPLAKLALQIGAAVVVLASGLEVEIVGNEVLAWGIGILWLVGITNAFNLLDNMDGLAATLAAIACGYFAIDAMTEHPNETVLVLALALGVA